MRIHCTSQLWLESRRYADANKKSGTIAAPDLSSVPVTRYWTFKFTSSITNEVCRLESSLAVNLITMVCPMKEFKLNDFWLYPVAWFRLEKVASVDSTVPLVFSTCTLIVSNAVVVVVSAVSMCSQNVRVALVFPAGMLTV